MVTTELRRDPITGRSVLIDLSTQIHPDEFLREALHVGDAGGARSSRSDHDAASAGNVAPVGAVASADNVATPGNAASAGDVASCSNVASAFRRTSCAFCEGREADAGAELLAWREGSHTNEPGWSVRVVANRRPMLRIEGGQDERVDGLFQSRDGLGAHEVVIETPLHDQALQDLPADRLWRVLWAWRTRLQDLKRDTRFASAVIFKNHGRISGARMDHAHSQIVVYPIVPTALDDKVRAAANHYRETVRCIFCDLVSQELQDGRRVVSDTLPVVAIAPFASRVPFETWLLPREHAARFEEATDATLEALAVTMKDVMSRIDWALERPAYNLVLHTAPFSGEPELAFHWHLEVIPRVTRWSGLDVGTGIPRNPVSPEEAARVLRRRGASFVSTVALAKVEDRRPEP